MNIELMPHQKRASDEIMANLDKGVVLLAGETRSGKSLTALTVCKEIGGRVLFVTKKKAIESIEGDISLLWGDEPNNVTVINFERLRGLNGPFSFVVVDESHNFVSSYPKESAARREVKRLVGDAPVLVMSGTPSIEGSAKLYGQMTLGKSGPWSGYPTFYQWWFAPGHYKDNRPCGGYGIQDAVKSTGRRVNAWDNKPPTDYSQVDEERVLDEVEPYVVRMTREEAGYKVQDATIIPVELKNTLISGLIRDLIKTKVCNELGIVLDKGPAQVLQCCHMLAGGTYKREGEAEVLPDRYDPAYRARWIAKGMDKAKSYAILTAYIEERSFVAGHLRLMGHTVHDELDELKESGSGCFVGSLSSLSEGVDMSWLTGSQILYSLSWSGAKFSQICDRQLNYKREKPAKVAIPLLKGGVDKRVFDAVSSKCNFNAGFYGKL